MVNNWPQPRLAAERFNRFCAASEHDEPNPRTNIGHSFQRLDQIALAFESPHGAREEHPHERIRMTRLTCVGKGPGLDAIWHDRDFGFWQQAIEQLPQLF